MTLYVTENQNFRLKLIEEHDIYDLMKWKNANKQFFFLKTDITKDQQEKWFQQYIKDKENFMFVVQEQISNHYQNVGCMGFRITDNLIDVYNIMRGKTIDGSMNTMANAMLIMLNYINNIYKFDITCKVLPENPARIWYQKLGFEEQYTTKDYIFYTMNITNLKKINIVKEK